MAGEVSERDPLADRNVTARKTIPSFVIGKRRVVDRLELDRYVESRNAEAKAHARALAEVCGALALAGEISLTSAICANEFVRAHQKLARGRNAGQKADNA